MQFIVGWRNINDCNLSSPSSSSLSDSVECVASISKSIAGSSASRKKDKKTVVGINQTIIYYNIKILYL